MARPWPPRRMRSTPSCRIFCAECVLRRVVGFFPELRPGGPGRRRPEVRVPAARAELFELLSPAADVLLPCRAASMGACRAALMGSRWHLIHWEDYQRAVSSHREGPGKTRPPRGLFHASEPWHVCLPFAVPFGLSSLAAATPLELVRLAEAHEGIAAGMRSLAEALGKAR